MDRGSATEVSLESWHENYPRLQSVTRQLDRRKKSFLEKLKSQPESAKKAAIEAFTAGNQASRKPETFTMYASQHVLADRKKFLSTLAATLNETERKKTRTIVDYGHTSVGRRVDTAYSRRTLVYPADILGLVEVDVSQEGLFDANTLRSKAGQTVQKLKKDYPSLIFGKVSTFITDHPEIVDGIVELSDLVEFELGFMAWHELMPDPEKQTWKGAQAIYSVKKALGFL